MTKTSNNDFREGDYVQRTKVLEESVNKLEKDLPARVLSAIEGTVQIQDKIKELVWCAVKDKIVWIILGGLFTLGLAFAHGYFNELGRMVASPHVEAVEVN